MMKKMRKLNYIFTGAIAAVLITSCSDFLDPYPTAIRSEDYVLQYGVTMQGIVEKCYDNMSRNYNNNEGAYLDGATDNAVITSATDALRRLSTGVSSNTSDPFQTYWQRDYEAIYNLNFFLYENRGRNVRYMLDEHHDELLRNRLIGEAFGLRAWFYWDLLQKFGGRGTDGNMLGVPIILEPVKIWEMDPDEIDIHQLEMPDILIDGGKVILAQFLDVVEVAVEGRIVIHPPQFDFSAVGIVNDALLHGKRRGSRACQRRYARSRRQRLV